MKFYQKEEITIFELKKDESTLEDAFIKLIDSTKQEPEEIKEEKKQKSLRKRAKEERKKIKKRRKRIMFAVYKKELKSYFLSPTGYITIGLFFIII